MRDLRVYEYETCGHQHLLVGVRRFFPANLHDLR